MESFILSKKLLIAVFVALLALGIGAYAVFATPAAKIGTSAGTCGVTASGVCNAPLPDIPVQSVSPATPPVNSSNGTKMQEIAIRALDTGLYDKPEITVKAGVPVRLTFTADPGAGCGRYMEITDFGVKLISRSGEAMVAEFIPTKPGTYYYHCGMWMWKGTLKVV